jgi:D-3-phosphoglycerate dehydrogenase / 2-oxoglutarate reductase
VTKVLISDNLSPRAAEIFRDRGVDVDVKVGMTPEELIACIGDYDGLAIRSATKVREEVLEAATNLKVIGRAGIGVDNVDINAASARGVVVMNTPFGNSITTAEHAIALMFALARQIPAADQSTQSGKWEKSRFMGVELTGKTLGVIGCGNIGSIVAERALGLRMKVVAYDPYLSPERASSLGVEKAELDELLRRADFITLHTPLTDSTRDILNADAFAKAKKGVRIVNCARGELIVEADLMAALESGQVGGVAVDVYSVEPPENYSLFGHDNVVATPHLGAATTEAQEKVALQVAEQMSDFLVDGAVVNAINMPSVSADEAPRLLPYMTLAEQLGSLAGQVAESSIKSVAIEFEGAVGQLNTKPMAASLLCGLLAPVMESVNMINAPILARDRDIAVSEVKHERESEYQTLIRLSVTTENRTRTFAGTLFGGDKPRIVNINGVGLEAELGPHMLYTINADKPGFIGRLGSILGVAGVNIATFHLGRDEAGGDAVALIEIDGPVSDEILNEVRAVDGVVQARTLKF